MDLWASEMEAFANGTKEVALALASLDGKAITIVMAEIVLLLLVSLI